MFKRITMTVCAAMATLWWAVGGGAGCYYYDDDDDCDLKIQTEALPPASLNVEYRFNLDSKCGGDDWFITEGNLPPGISLQSDGDLLGVPVAVGIFNFTVGVVEYDYYDFDEAFKGFQIVVTGAPLPTPTPTVGSSG
jgi:hypothetical protein